MDNSAIVETKGLVKRFPVGGGQFTALRDIDLTFGKGEFTGVVGPSGSGKTTLLNIIGSLDSPSDGVVMVLGQSVGALTHKRAARLRNEHLGFIFQTYNLLPVISAAENVELPLLITGVRPREARERALAVLEEFTPRKPRH